MPWLEFVFRSYRSTLCAACVDYYAFLSKDSLDSFLFFSDASGGLVLFKVIEFILSRWVVAECSCWLYLGISSEVERVGFV